MKRFAYLLSALALVVSMQGCGSSPSVEPEIPDSPNNPTQSAVQLRLKGNIASLAPSTRVNEAGFEAEDKVGVYVSATGALASSGNMLDNTAFTYSSGNLTAPEGKEVYWGTPETKLSVWAYYPYAESVSSNSAYPFVVNADQSTAEKFYNSDFITAKATNLAPQTEAVNLTFNHSLSKINITLEAGEGITADDLAAAEKSFSIGELVTAGTIDLATGTATAGEATATITPLASGGVNYSAIVYPQQGEVAFRMVMDGDTYLYSTDVDFAAGMQYDYTLTINVREPQQMNLKTTTITPWGDGADHAGVMSDIINIPDPVFKEYLLNAVVYEEREYDPNSYSYVEGDIVHLGSGYTNIYYHPTTQKIDANNDGEISFAEAEKVVMIDVGNLDIANMSGLEFFTNLTALRCSHNPKRVEEVQGEDYYTYNDVTLPTLDISKNTKLQALSCEWCALTSLDVSKNTELVLLWCGFNEFTTIDLSNNLKLKAFRHQYYYTPYADVKAKSLNSIDVTKNTALTSLEISSDLLTSIDVTKNTALTSLSIRGDMLTSIDVTKNTALTSLSIRGDMLTSIDVAKNTALEYLICGSNQLTSLDVSKNTNLTYLHCDGNQLTLLDVSKNTALEDLYCYNNQLTSLDVSHNTELRILHCGSNQLSSLDISNCTKLNTLTCYTNNLTSLDLSNNPALEALSCSQNRLTTLDVTHNTLLNHLNCEQNLITSLDLSKNSNLQYLICSPMDDADGYNLLETIYIAEGQSIGSLTKPNATNMVVKE